MKETRYRRISDNLSIRYPSKNFKIFLKEKKKEPKKKRKNQPPKKWAGVPLPPAHF